MTFLTIIVRATQRALSAVTDSFSPPTNASSQTIRVNGAICIGIGALCVAAFVAFAIWLHAAPEMLFLPSLLTYALIAVGGYRIIRGKEPQAHHPGEGSALRILIGCVSAIFCFALLAGMSFLGLLLFGP